MTTKKKYKDFETALERLEQITGLLESGNATLEESILLYTEGMEIAAYCTGKLAEAEKKIMALKSIDGRLREVPFMTDDVETEERNDDES